MKRIVLVAAAALVMVGCGKKASESIAEKMIEHAMAKDGVKGKVNISDGKMSVETKDGTSTFSAGGDAKVPDTFPKDVPVYAGTKVLMSINVPNGANLILESGDSVEKIVAFYKSKMTGAGWKEEMSMNQPNTTILAYKKEPRTVQLAVTQAGTTSQITLTVADK